MGEENTDLFIEEGQTTGIRGDLNYKLIIMMQINRIGLTLSKLPMENRQSGRNDIHGCTHESIRTSFADGVRTLECLLNPYADPKYTKEHERLIKASDGLVFFARYTNALNLCSRLGLLLDISVKEEIG